MLLFLFCACGRLDFAVPGDPPPLGLPRPGAACRMDAECGRCSRCTDGTCALEPIEAVFLGHRSSCFLGPGGARWCAGENTAGELGLGDLTERNDFTLAHDGDQWVSITNFYMNTAGVRRGLLWSWGGGLAAPTAAGSAALVREQVGDISFLCNWFTDLTTSCEPSGTTWQSLAAGAGHTCGVTQADQRLMCEGGNHDGAAGQPATTATVETMTEVGAGLGPWAEVAVGGNGSNAVTCARTQAGQIYCFGSPELTGLNGAATDGAPALVNDDADWVWVKSRFERTCAGKADGRVFCWGTDTFGAFIVPGQHAVPVPTQLDGTYDQIVLGGHHVCGHTSTGWQCFGWNESGQLGIGNRDTPEGLVGMCSAD
jgi:alpha-tubulin suppressor-like RCC1 family protein